LLSCTLPASGLPFLLLHIRPLPPSARTAACLTSVCSLTLSTVPPPETRLPRAYPDGAIPDIPGTLLLIDTIPCWTQTQCRYNLEQTHEPCTSSIPSLRLLTWPARSILHTVVDGTTTHSSRQLRSQHYYSPLPCLWYGSDAKFITTKQFFAHLRFTPSSAVLNFIDDR
jgi:hypothetical protein